MIYSYNIYLRTYHSIHFYLPFIFLAWSIWNGGGWLCSIIDNSLTILQSSSHSFKLKSTQIDVEALIAHFDCVLMPHYHANYILHTHIEEDLERNSTFLLSRWFFYCIYSRLSWQKWFSFMKFIYFLLAEGLGKQRA